MQALSQDETLAGSEFVTDSPNDKNGDHGVLSMEESKGGNSTNKSQPSNDFGAFQFKSSLVIQSQDIKNKNNAIEEEMSNSSDSENHKMSEADNELLKSPND